MKKLNNKGFTLIELLAVIVILAVVMGVAASSVLGAMNNSRKSQLQNSAASAADSFRTAYAAYSMTPSDGILGVTDTTKINNLLNGTAISLSEFKGGLNITVGNSNSNANYLNGSAVRFDKATSSFVVCMLANPNGSYYVANAALAHSTAADAKKPAVSQGLTAGTSYMWACSDNTHSW